MKSRSLSRVLHLLQLHMEAVTEMATMSLACGQERLGLFRRFGVHAPLFHAGDRHGGVEGFQTGFFFRDGHASLCESQGIRSLGKIRARNKVETRNVKLTITLSPSSTRQMECFSWRRVRTGKAISSSRSSRVRSRFFRRRPSARRS